MKKILVRSIYEMKILIILNRNNKLLILNSVKQFSNQPYITTGYKKSQTLTGNAISPKNMSLRHCSPIPMITLMDPMIKSVAMTTMSRPLTIILAWMLAKDKHLEKYQQMWIRRGFDVLTVKISPIDLLMPPIGSQVVASNLVKYLSEITPQYKEIIIHAFSVGGYQYGEILLKLKSSDRYKKICDSLKGIIIDSMVHVEDCAPGLSRAITNNFILQPIIEGMLRGYLSATKSISLKNHRNSSNQIFENPLGLPGLLLFSNDDIVSTIKSNIKLAESWKKLGLTVQTKCWQKSTHVAHYREHQCEYEEELDSYLKKLKLSLSQVV